MACYSAFEYTLSGQKCNQGGKGGCCFPMKKGMVPLKGGNLRKILESDGLHYEVLKRLSHYGSSLSIHQNQLL